MIVRKHLFIWRDGSTFQRVAHDDRRLIHVDENPELVPGTPLIIGLDRKGVAQLPLDSEVVLIQVRASQIRIDSLKTYDSDGRSSRPLPGEVRDQRHVLIEADCPRKLSRLRDIRCLSDLQIVRRAECHRGRHVVEKVVVGYAKAAANHGFVYAEDSLKQSRAVGKSEHRREVVLVRINAARWKRERRFAKDQRRRALQSRVDIKHAVGAHYDRTDSGNDSWSRGRGSLRRPTDIRNGCRSAA